MVQPGKNVIGLARGRSSVAGRLLPDGHRSGALSNYRSALDPKIGHRCQVASWLDSPGLLIAEPGQPPRRGQALWGPPPADRRKPSKCLNNMQKQAKQSYNRTYALYVNGARGGEEEQFSMIAYRVCLYAARLAWAKGLASATRVLAGAGPFLGVSVGSQSSPRPPMTPGRPLLDPVILRAGSRGNGKVEGAWRTPGM